MPEPPPVLPRDLFAPPPPFGGADAARSSAGRGVAIWLIAAASLVIGILIGFASGYTAGRRAEAAFVRPESGGTAGRPAPDAADGTFTETEVTERVRVDPEPIVTAPEPSAGDPPSTPAPRAAAPAPAPQEAAPAPVERAAPPAPASTRGGTLQVVSRPSGAQVTLDGRVIGRTPLVISDVRAGRHDVRLELAGFRAWATSVEVDGATRARVAASLEP